MILKPSTYKNLVDLEIYKKKPIADKDVKDSDITIKISDKRYKIETNDLSNQELLITIMTKQALYAKKLYDFLFGLFVFSVIAGIIYVFYNFS